MKFQGKGELTPHMLTGLPSASSGVRFLLNFLPPEEGLVEAVTDPFLLSYLLVLAC